MKYMSKLACTLACAVLLVGAAFAMSWSSDKMLIGDSYIDESFEEENFGTGETLWVTSEEDEPMMESWLYFDTNLMKENLGIESSDEVDSATLKIYAKNVDSPGEVELHFYNEGFFEETIVWEGKPDYDEEVDDVKEVDEEGWYEFDATETVKKAIDECTECPFSMVLVAKGDASIGFASKEDADENVPVLSVTTIEG